MSGDVVLVATRSRDKLAELRDLLAGLRGVPVSLAELGVEESPEESRLERWDTFAANALAKARHFHARTGLPTLADDSGLCVDALGGEPGVCSRRFAPEEWAARLGRDPANNAWLLHLLRGVPPEARTAHYRCAIALVDGEGAWVAEGRVAGRIAEAARGEGGFGYDPLFVVQGEERTFSELPPAAKARLSHRAQAARALRERLEGKGVAGGARGGAR